MESAREISTHKDDRLDRKAVISQIAGAELIAALKLGCYGGRDCKSSSI